MSMPKAEIRQALLDVENGNPLPPNIFDILAEHGWVEWVDDLRETPVDRHSPRARARLTAAGRAYLWG